MGGNLFGRWDTYILYVIKKTCNQANKTVQQWGNDKTSLWIVTSTTTVAVQRDIECEGTGMSMRH